MGITGRTCGNFDPRNTREGRERRGVGREAVAHGGEAIGGQLAGSEEE